MMIRTQTPNLPRKKRHGLFEFQESDGPTGRCRKPNFESSNIQVSIPTIRNFIRESFEQLCPCNYDIENYDDLDSVVELVDSLEILLYNKFYMQYLHFLKNYVLDIGIR